jgi:signal recognition particle receptor subunit beta
LILNDVERIDESTRDVLISISAVQELEKLLEDELRDAALLVFANKQDSPHSMSVSEITEKLGLNRIRNRPWYIQGMLCYYRRWTL